VNGQTDRQFLEPAGDIRENEQQLDDVFRPRSSRQCFYLLAEHRRPWSDERTTIRRGTYRSETNMRKGAERVTPHFIKGSECFGGTAGDWSRRRTPTDPVECADVSAAAISQQESGSTTRATAAAQPATAAGTTDGGA